MAKVTSRANTAKKWTLIVLVMFLLVAVIAGTYARYTKEGKATGNVPTAKWAVTIKNGSTTLNSTTKNIPFVVQSNTNVVPGKIAPGVTAKAQIEVDLTGTEVAVDLSAAIDKSAIASTWGASYDKLSLTATLDGQSYTVAASNPATVTVPLVGNTAFTASNGKKILELTLTWTNDDENNVDDTTTGEAAPTLTIPVTLTAQQKI